MTEEQKREKPGSIKRILIGVFVGIPAAIVLLVLIAFLASRGDSESQKTGAGAAPAAEQGFCGAINQSRQAFQGAERAANDLQKEERQKAARLLRKTRMARAVPDSLVIGWFAKVEEITPIEEGAFASFTLPCGAALKGKVGKENDFSPSLRALQLGAAVTIVGILKPTSGEGKDAFQELSLTESGSMDEPEFGFHLAGFGMGHSSLNQASIDGALKVLPPMLEEWRKIIAGDAEKTEAGFLLTKACLRAQRAVEKHLKSPKSADFPDCGWSLEKYKIKASPDRKTFWVQGYVDAQNGFGAMIRSKWVVQLSRSQDTQGEEIWAVVDLAIE